MLFATGAVREASVALRSARIWSIRAAAPWAALAALAAACWARSWASCRESSCFWSARISVIRLSWLLAIRLTVSIRSIRSLSECADIRNRLGSVPSLYARTSVAASSARAAPSVCFAASDSTCVSRAAVRIASARRWSACSAASVFCLWELSQSIWAITRAASDSRGCCPPPDAAVAIPPARTASAMAARVRVHQNSRHGV